jgi:hypothetical protein
MNADTDMDLFVFVFSRVMLPKPRLDLLGALDGVDDGGEINEKSVTHGLDDRAMMCADSLVNNLIMDIKLPQHAGFIAAHLAAEAHDVGEHDRGQFAGLDSWRM